jgi:octaprenyl-diphosphate synthase
VQSSSSTTSSGVPPVTGQLQPSLSKELLASLLREMPGMAQVEALVRSKLTSESSQLEEIGTYLLELGGKRVRPLLCLLLAQALRCPLKQALLDVASGIELIHMATLLHDDIIDKSPLRRHQTSAFKRYGLENTLLCGDFLLTRAFSLCARLDAAVIEATEIACVHLTEGEIAETPLFSAEHSVDSSLMIARKKTAALFRLASFSAGHIAQRTPALERDLAQFGEDLGIAFQIVDDILDVISTEEVLGKMAGIDLRERKPSVVNVLWLQSGSALAQTLKKPPQDEAAEQVFVAAGLQELRSSPVLAKAKQLAEEYVQRALKSLDRAFDGQSEVDQSALGIIKALAQYTLQRLQ